MLIHMLYVTFFHESQFRAISQMKMLKSTFYICTMSIKNDERLLAHGHNITIPGIKMFSIKCSKM